jgi:hypothetical protein
MTPRAKARRIAMNCWLCRLKRPVQCAGGPQRADLHRAEQFSFEEKLTKTGAMPCMGTRHLLPRIRSKASSVIIPAPLSTQQAERSALSEIKHATVGVSNSFDGSKPSYFHCFPLIFMANLSANHEL